MWCNSFFDQNFGPHAGAQHIALATLVGILGRTVYWQIQPGNVMPNGLSKFSEMVVSSWISPLFQGPQITVLFPSEYGTQRQNELRFFKKMYRVAL